MRSLHLVRHAIIAALFAGTALGAKAADFTVAYQTSVSPAVVAQADGAYEQATHSHIDWRKFDDGASVVAALASSSVQFGYLGSSPDAAAASRKVPVETFLIAAKLNTSEALVVRDKSGIAQPADLIGKKVATPFVSTSHYSLLAALKHWRIDPSKVQILNLNPPAIDQQRDALGAPTVTALANTSRFLKEQGKIDEVLPDYSPYVSARYLPEGR